MRVSKTMYHVPDDFVTDPRKHLVDSGLLFRINREVLHPLGLSLGVSFEDNSIKLLDFQKERGGVVYDLQSLRECSDALNNYMLNEGNDRHLERLHKHGFIVQPLDGEYNKEEIK